MEKAPTIRPWEEYPEDICNMLNQKEKAKSYKYVSMFEPPPLTEAQASFSSIFHLE
jgi:hypothetical protein